MASNVVFSTLMVLLSKSDQDFEELWNTAGAMNDPTGDKHQLDLHRVIRAGNFRSALVDDWANLSFDSVSLYGMNMVGDIFWETEFLVTGTESDLSSWLVGEHIINTSTEVLVPQITTYSSENYRLRIGPADKTDHSWFAVSSSNLSYGRLPLIFVPSVSNRSFSNPVFIDGLLGCWYLSDIINEVFMYEDAAGMSPHKCIKECWDNFTIAMLTETTKCYCADVDTNSPPTNDADKCYLFCPGTLDFCGGFSSNAGNAYHVQGGKLPGFQDTVILYHATHTYANNTIEIDSFDINKGSIPDAAFITKVIVKVPGQQVLNYTIRYSESTCLETAGYKKYVSFDGTDPTAFSANGSIADVDILKVGCIEIVFSRAISDVSLELWGPDVTNSAYVEVPAFVIRGKTKVASTSFTSVSYSSNETVPTTVASTSTTAMSSTTNSTLLTAASPSPSTESSTYNNTVTSETFSAGSATDQTGSISICFCPCNGTPDNLTKEELQEKILQIQQRLLVNVSLLSSTIRKLTSAEDSRVSAVSIGYVGIAILASVFSAIVLIDSTMLFRDMKKFVNNIKAGLCASREY